MSPFARTLSAFALVVVTATAAFASTKEEASSQANAFVAHAKKVGIEQAIKDANTAADWKTGGLNVNVVDMKGKCHASSLNEKLVGKETLEIKDPSGKEFVKEFIATAKKGEGWVDYQFINPVSKKLEERSMFVKKLPNFDGFVGVGITKN